MVRAQMVVCVLIAFSLSVFCLEMKGHKKTHSVSFRIAAVTEHVARSSFSPNRETYLVYMVGKNVPSTAAKVVFRYLDYEDGLSEDFADFGIVHTFKAIRDRSCDESWQSFSTKFVVGKDGNPLPVAITRYAAPEAAQDISADQVLPCYVITPQGYKSSKAVSGPQTNSQIAEGR